MERSRSKRSNSSSARYLRQVSLSSQGIRWYSEKASRNALDTLNHPRSIAAASVGITIDVWRRLDRPEFARYGGLFARSENIRTAASVASGVSHGAWEQLLTREDLDILTILANRSEPGVLHATIWGLKRLTKVAAFRPAALDLIAGMKINGHQGLAQDYIEIFGHHGLSAAMLTATQVEKIVTNLVEVEQLREHSIDGLMASVCGVAPRAIVSFLEARIVRAIALEQQGVDNDYEPIPTSSSWSVLRAARNNGEYGDALAAFVDLMKRYPRYEHLVSTIFWRMADVWPSTENTGTATFAALDRLLHTSESEDALIVVRSLDDAPLGLTIHHPMFALHILWTFAAFGEDMKDAAMNRLVGNCFASGGFGAVQPGAPVLCTPDLPSPGRKQWPTCSPSVSRAAWPSSCSKESLTLPSLCTIRWTYPTHLRKPMSPKKNEITARSTDRRRTERQR
jgi:hypothetical protein